MIFFFPLPGERYLVSSIPALSKMGYFVRPKQAQQMVQENRTETKIAKKCRILREWAKTVLSVKPPELVPPYPAAHSLH
jgi:hypothetical protein